MKHDRTTELRYPGLSRGRLGAWAPCLGPTGLALRDWSPYRNSGILQNFDIATAWNPTGRKYGLRFDGVDDVVSMGAWRPLSTTSPFTFEAWIDLTFLSGNRYPVIASFRTNSGMFSFAISNDNNYLGMLIGSANVAWGRFSNGLAASVWSGPHHVAYTYSGSGPTTAGSFRTYFDATEIAVSVTPAFAAQVVDESRFGGDGGALSFFSGCLLSASLYGRVLTPKEKSILASRPGIAHELAPRRRSSVQVVAGFKAAWIPRRSLVIGGGTN
jgi:hypothetical protein